jgi:predicted nucleotidyltransferase
MGSLDCPIFLAMNEILTQVNGKLAELGHGAKLICLAYVGSRAYGFNTPKSDIDVFGIYLPSELGLYGLDTKPDFIRLPKQNNVEGMLHDIRKWFKLIKSQNPNILETLWLRDEDYLYTDGVYWPFLKARRREFLYQDLARAYSSYAYQQLQRLKQFNEKETKNVARVELFEKFGFDTKAASYVIKLLLTGIEAVTKGTITPRRPVAELELIKNIRAGMYRFEEIVDMWEGLDRELSQSNNILQAEIPPLLLQNLQLTILRSHSGILEHERHKNGISQDLQTGERQVRSDEN